MTLTKAQVYDAGRDAGNREMVALNLTAWNDACHGVACDEVDRIIAAIGGVDVWMSLPAR